ncbi:MAG: Ada metal-binding domain-containing protein [Eubacteriaceae bacterium]|jgi:hypothetical protein
MEMGVNMDRINMMISQLKKNLSRESGKRLETILVLIAVSFVVTMSGVRIVQAFPQQVNSQTMQVLTAADAVTALSQDTKELLDDSGNGWDQAKWQKIDDEYDSVKETVDKTSGNKKTEELAGSLKAYMVSLQPVIENGKALADDTDLNADDESTYNNLISAVEDSNQKYGAINDSVDDSLKKDAEKTGTSVALVALSSPSMPKEIEDDKNARIAAEAARVEAERAAAQKAEEDRIAAEQAAAAEKAAADQAAADQAAAEQSSAQASTAVTSGGTYVLNTNTGKFHYASCRYVKQMNDSNKAFTQSREEAISEGYEPCKVCRP